MPMVPSSYLSGKLALGAGGNEVDFAGGEIGHIGLFTAAEAVAFLGFLAIAEESEGAAPVLDGEIDLEEVGPGQREAQFLRLTADVIVVHRQPGAEDDRVETVQGGAAKAELFGQRGQGRGGGVGGDAEDDVEVRIDVGGEAERATGGGPGGVGQVQVAAAGDGVGEEIAAAQIEFGEDALFEALVEDVVGVPLDGE